MWSALHLEDGTHTHAVSVPTHPDFGVGYVQRDGQLTELTNVNSSEQVADNGLITSARIAMSPVDIEVELEPLAFGAILLEASDGRISQFPRAMCRVRATDGRRLGRMEPKPAVPSAVTTLRIATWNANSVKRRLPRLLPWCSEDSGWIRCQNG
jgi:hypothetical protein